MKKASTVGLYQRTRRFRILAALGIALPWPAGLWAAVTVSGNFEGSNVVDIQETAPNNFTCKLKTPPMPVPSSNRYNTPGDHYHDWFMLKIEGAASQTVTVSLTNADWEAGTFWGRADGQAVYTEASDPHALSTDATWQKITTWTYSNPIFTFTITPTTNLVWVALGYPALPTHTTNWIAAQAASPYVTTETLLTTSQGRPMVMIFITNSSIPLTGKKGIVVYGQEHMNEQNGGWTCQGLVEFLTSSDPVAQTLRDNSVFIVIPDMNPDATAAGTNCDPEDGKTPEWTYNPAAVERLMSGMLVPMTLESKVIWNRLVSFVENGGRIDFCFNIHQGGADNFWGVYELADPRSIGFDYFLRYGPIYMPQSGAAWVPNLRQGYSRGGWQNYLPTGPFACRLLGRCWEEWRTVPMGYELALGSYANNFLNTVDGIKYFGKALALAANDYFGQFLKTITLTSPNGGESFASGSNTLVTWATTGSVSNIRIDVSVNSGAAWTNLLASTSNDASETVTLPSTNSASCLLRISDAGALGVGDESDSPFAIGTPPTGAISVTSPNGSETWDTNWWNTVTWNNTGSISNVKIELSTDNGLTWKRLAYAVPNNGTYPVNIPNSISSLCRIRVIGIENPNVSDISNAPFSIQSEPAWPTLNLISPIGGETWTPGGTAEVRWSTTGVVDNVGISLSIDESASWTELVSSTTNDGAEIVNVPNTPSSKCLIWVYDSRNDPWLNRPDADPMDVSDGLFTIGIFGTRTSTSTASPTPTLTPTATISETATITPTLTYSPTPTESYTVSPTPTISATFSVTPTRTCSPTISPTSSTTPTSSMSPTRTISATWTLTRISPDAADPVVVFPNPAKAELSFIWKEPDVSGAHIDVYNLAGERIASLNQPGPGNRLNWQIRQIAPGLYFYRVILKKGKTELQLPIQKLVIKP